MEATWKRTYAKLERDTTKFDIVFTLGRSSRKIFVWLLLGPYTRNIPTEKLKNGSLVAPTPGALPQAITTTLKIQTNVMRFLVTAAMPNQGWGLLKFVYKFLHWQKFWFCKKKYLLGSLNHFYIWLLLPQLSCCYICQIWIWYSLGNQCFDNHAKIGKIRRQRKLGLVTPTQTQPQIMCKFRLTISDLFLKFLDIYTMLISLVNLIAAPGGQGGVAIIVFLSVVHMPSFTPLVQVMARPSGNKQAIISMG